MAHAVTFLAYCALGKHCVFPRYGFCNNSLLHNGVRQQAFFTDRAARDVQSYSGLVLPIPLVAVVAWVEAGITIFPNDWHWLSGGQPIWPVGSVRLSSAMY